MLDYDSKELDLPVGYHSMFRYCDVLPSSPSLLTRTVLILHLKVREPGDEVPTWVLRWRVGDMQRVWCKHKKQMSKPIEDPFQASLVGHGDASAPTKMLLLCLPMKPALPRETTEWVDLEGLPCSLCPGDSCPAQASVPFHFLGWSFVTSVSISANRQHEPCPLGQVAS